MILIGTDGFAVPPNIKKYEDLNVFFDATCRSFKLKFIESATSRTWIYKSDPNTWKSVYDIPENRGYCVDGRCSKHGIINMEKCTEVVQGVSAPIFASQPHFLAGDSSLISDFEGVLPNETAHEFYFMEVDPLEWLENYRFISRFFRCILSSLKTDRIHARCKKKNAAQRRLREKSTQQKIESNRRR